MWSGACNYKRYVSENLFILALLFVLVIASIGLGAAGASELHVAPVNPAFERYMERLRTVGPPVLATPEGYYLGHIPGPVNLSHLLAPRELPQGPIGVPPPFYDLRTLGRLTPVRHQGGCGSCWAQATMASLESWLLTVGEGTWDLSENNLKECHGFTWGPCEGGNYYISTAYLGRRDGPIAEADDPYRDYVTGCTFGLPICRYLREVSVLTDMTLTKEGIMLQGAMYTAFYWNSSYYDPATHTYYYNGGESSNHAVAIVGWDDNKSTPCGAPGAWICKNSWGTDWGENGYFYLSYCDTYAVGNTGYATMFWDGRDPECSTVYQHDPLGWVYSWGGYGDHVCWGANVFMTTQAGYLTRVAFYTTDANTDYWVYIKRGGPDGAVAYDQGGWLTDPYAGYHTVDLTNPVALSNEEIFTVVVKFSNPTYDFPLAVEGDYAGYSDAAVSPGQSYESHDGGNTDPWYDISDPVNEDPPLNACIKAIVWPAAQDTSAVFRVNDLGCVFADGNISGHALDSGKADVAEWVSVSESVEPGDVLELDPSSPGFYRRARGACSTLVAGVVSTEPGVILGSSSPTLDIGPWTLDSALLALLGIAPVKVTDEGGPIQPGDLLVVSSTPGYAMRWDPDTDRTCGLVGKALEPLGSGTGMIQMLLMR